MDEMVVQEVQAPQGNLVQVEELVELVLLVVMVVQEHLGKPVDLAQQEHPVS